MTYKIENQDLLSIINQIDGLDKYYWSIQWFEGISIESINILEIEKEIKNSKNGILMNSEDLIEFIRPIKQIFEIVILGDKNKEKLYRYLNDDEAKLSCQFYIELVDSSYWEVASQDFIFIKKIKKELAAIEI